VKVPIVKNDKSELSDPFRLLLEQFIEHLQAQGYRMHTIRGFRSGIAPFLRYVQESGRDLKEFGTRQLQSYAAHLAERPGVYGGKLCVASRHKIMGNIKTFFRFLNKSGRIHYDPAAALELPRKPQYLPRAILSVDETGKLLALPDLQTPIGIRNRAIMELLYSAGLRNEEVTLLDVNDIDLAGRTALIHGKGGKDAVVPFGRQAAHAVEHYIHFARDQLVNAIGTGRPVSERRKREDDGRHPLFVTAQGVRMMIATVTHMVKYYSHKPGITKPITPHCLRHTCATHLLRNGADVRHIQQLLRHSSINSTQIYTRVAIEDLKEAQRRFHPREREPDDE
jgi:integrase/recombinase XerD